MTTKTKIMELLPDMGVVRCAQFILPLQSEAIEELVEEGKVSIVRGKHKLIYRIVPRPENPENPPLPPISPEAFSVAIDSDTNYMLIRIHNGYNNALNYGYNDMRAITESGFATCVDEHLSLTPMGLEQLDKIAKAKKMAGVEGDLVHRKRRGFIRRKLILQEKKDARRRFVMDSRKREEKSRKLQAERAQAVYDMLTVPMRWNQLSKRLGLANRRVNEVIGPQIEAGDLQFIPTTTGNLIARSHIAPLPFQTSAAAIEALLQLPGGWFRRQHVKGLSPAPLALLVSAGAVDIKSQNGLHWYRLSQGGLHALRCLDVPEPPVPSDQSNHLPSLVLGPLHQALMVMLAAVGDQYIGTYHVNMMFGNRMLPMNNQIEVTLSWLEKKGLLEKQKGFSKRTWLYRSTTYGRSTLAGTPGHVVIADLASLKRFIKDFRERPRLIRNVGIWDDCKPVMFRRPDGTEVAPIDFIADASLPALPDYNSKSSSAWLQSGQIGSNSEAIRKRILLGCAKGPLWLQNVRMSQASSAALANVAKRMVARGEIIRLPGRHAIYALSDEKNINGKIARIA